MTTVYQLKESMVRDDIFFHAYTYLGRFFSHGSARIFQMDHVEAQRTGDSEHHPTTIPISGVTAATARQSPVNCRWVSNTPLPQFSKWGNVILLATGRIISLRKGSLPPLLGKFPDQPAWKLGSECKEQPRLTQSEVGVPEMTESRLCPVRCIHPANWQTASPWQRH